MKHSQFYSKSPKFIFNMLIVSIMFHLCKMVLFHLSFIDFSFSLYSSSVEARVLSCPVRSLKYTKRNQQCEKKYFLKSQFQKKVILAKFFSNTPPKPFSKILTTSSITKCEVS